MNASNNRTVSGGHLPLLKCLIPAGSKRTKIEKKKKKSRRRNSFSGDENGTAAEGRSKSAVKAPTAIKGKLKKK